MNNQSNADDDVEADASTGVRPRWAVVCALGIVQIFAWGGSFYLLTVVAAPIQADTGWPLPWIIGSLSVGLLVSGIVSPRVGNTIDRRGGRFVLAVSSPLLAVGLVVSGFAPNLPAFIAGWVIIGLGMGAGLYDAAFATLGQIYRERARSAITGLTLWAGFSSTISWPLSAWFAANLGWRGAFFGYAAIQLLVCLPLVLTMIPRHFPRAALPNATAASATLTFSAHERRLFLIVSGVFVMAGTSFSILTIHLLTLLQTHGVTLENAVLLGTLIGPAQVVGRIVEMSNRGRHHPLWTLTFAVLLIAVGMTLLATGFAIMGIAIVLYGAGNGVFSIARGTVPLIFFGPDRYARVMGRLARPTLLAQALAPMLAAWVMTVGDAEFLLPSIAGLAVLNLAIVSLLWRYRFIKES
ncbi:MAG: MFS transporter [Pseudomonadota bacterium]